MVYGFNRWRSAAMVVLGCATTAMVGVVDGHAADLAVQAAPVVKAPPPAAPLSWQGFHIGAVAGAVFSDSSVTPQVAGGFLTNPNLGIYQAQYNNALGGSSTGFTIGGTIGYDWQAPAGNAAAWVFGLEADLSYAGSGTSGTALTASMITPGQFLTKSYSIDGSWFGTARARLGYAAGPTLFYVTGGLAVASSGADVTIRDSLGLYSWTGSTSGTRWGWTLGGGAEMRLDAHWSVKAEYLYVNLGSSSFTVNAAASNPIPTYTLNANADYAFNVVRAGINYRF